MLSPVPAPLSDELISDRRLVCGTILRSRCLASTADGCLGEVLGGESLAAVRLSGVRFATRGVSSLEAAASRSRSCASAASALLLLSLRSSLLSSSRLLCPLLSRLRLRLLVPSGTARRVPSCAAVPLVSRMLLSLASSNCLLSNSSSALSSSSLLLLFLPLLCSNFGRISSPGLYRCAISAFSSSLFPRPWFAAKNISSRVVTVALWRASLTGARHVGQV